MMSYLYNKKKKKRFFFYGILSILLILVMFTSLYSNIYSVLEKPFLNIYRNTEEFKNDSRKLFRSIFYSGKIIDENDSLKNEIEKLKIENKNIKYLESVINDSKNIISFDPNIVYTSVIKKNNSGTITILGGYNNGFIIGNDVIGGDGALVGKITKVYNNTSIVDLFIKEGNELDAILYINSGPISVNITGNGNALFSELIRDIDVRVGDVLYSQYDPGYIVGTVSAVDFDSRDSLKRVYISPIHNVLSLHGVGVIKK